MMPNFTVEEKAFVQSVRETVEGPLERIPCIRTISYLMARANTPEMSMMMDRVQSQYTGDVHDDGQGTEQTGDDDGCGVFRL